MSDGDTIGFFHVSDTHIGPTRDFLVYGKSTFLWAERAVQLINRFEGRVDFVVHGGDVVNRVYAESLALVRQVFAPLRYPVYYVAGNHDTSTSVRTLMAGRNDVTPLNNDEGVCYTFSAGHCRCLVLDTRGPDTIDPHGVFDDSRRAILTRFLAEAGAAPVLIFLHFPPLSLDSLWLDRDMLMINGERLHQTLVDAGSRILGVFFGHVHRHVTMHRDGILYSGAPSAFCQFGALPGDAAPRFEPGAPTGISYVAVQGTQVIVKELRFGEDDLGQVRP